MNKEISNKIGILIIVLVTILAIGILVWQFGMLKEEVKVLKSKAPTIKKPEQVVFEFYRCYIENKLKKNLNFESAIDKCDSLKDEYRQSLLKEEIRLADPIIRAQDYSNETDIRIEEIKIKDGSASVIVDFLPKEFWVDHKLEVFTVLENNEWRISDIREISKR
jgi:hypothetical protein